MFIRMKNGDAVNLDRVLSITTAKSANHADRDLTVTFNMEGGTAITGEVNVADLPVGEVGEALAENWVKHDAV